MPSLWKKSFTAVVILLVISFALSGSLWYQLNATRSQLNDTTAQLNETIAQLNNTNPTLVFNAGSRAAVEEAQDGWTLNGDMASCQPTSPDELDSSITVKSERSGKEV